MRSILVKRPAGRWALRPQIFKAQQSTVRVDRGFFFGLFHNIEHTGKDYSFLFFRGCLPFLKIDPSPIKEKENVLSLVKLIDKSNGYVFGGLTMGNEAIMNLAAGDLSWEYDR